MLPFRVFITTHTQLTYGLPALRLILLRICSCNHHNFYFLTFVLLYVYNKYAKIHKSIQTYNFFLIYFSGGGNIHSYILSIVTDSPPSRQVRATPPFNRLPNYLLLNQLSQVLGFTFNSIFLLLTYTVFTPTTQRIY